MNAKSHTTTTLDVPAEAVHIPVTRRVRRPSRRWKNLAVKLTFAGPGVLLLLVLSLYPMLILAQMAFSDVTITNILGEWPGVGLQNFAVVLGSSTFRAVAVQTLLFVAAILICTMAAGLFVALCLRSSRGFSLVTQTMLILVWTLPPVIVGSLWKFLLASNGAINYALVQIGAIDKPIPFLSQPSTGLTAIAAVTIWVGIPFAGLVIKSAVLDVPEDVLDAAKIDGASSTQILFRIVLPMIRPTLLILGVLIVVGAFKAFDLIYTMTRGGPGTASTTIPYLGYSTAFQTYQFGQAGAISLVAMAIVLLLAVAYIFALRKEDRS
ncbi:carbohydrate ABC transporter permease [Arthrobacter sp. MMS18-M83]|uniref:carbohydrate ABC transporter permease n=1 Tax=Arthrobacter sp. MMS18-M83 TaxID=2996261 RepID=UPI00227A5553|nr:sugar ABC transporter permease [Arthrobacter sp. MMS18-M83]WAH99165.1 sugar ABC transporter permease [Arthrobacter sp. MMS18-M83]